MLALRFCTLAAAAEPPSAPAAGTDVRLDLDAPPECTSRDELIARVAARSSRIRFVNEARTVTVLRVAIGVGPRGGFVGELDVADPDGRRFARRIEAPSCAQATDALALVIAITFDPMAAAASGVGGSSAAVPPAPTSPTPPSSPPAPMPAALPRPERVETDLVVDSPRPPTVFDGDVALGGEVVSGPAPGAMYGVALTATFVMDRHSLLSPAASASFAHVWAPPFAEMGGTANFSLDMATLDLCPVRLVASVLGVGACATGAYGRISARGTETYSPRVATRPLVTAGGAVILTVALGARFEVRGRFGAGASLVRDSFAFSFEGTPEVFHRTASVTLVGDLGVGVRFP